MRLGIIGGTFDPIHLGHLIVAEVARDLLALEMVLFVPAADPPHKQDETKSDSRCRRAMTELAIAANAHFKLSPVDLERPGPHYSTDTVRLVRRQYDLATEDCFFIIGGDSLRDLPTWHRPADLLSLCRLAVAHRPGYRPDMAELEANLPGLRQRLDWIESPTIDLSATGIRARVRQGQSIRYQVPEPVRAYIEQYELYRQEPARIR